MKTCVLGSHLLEKIEKIEKKNVNLELGEVQTFVIRSNELKGYIDEISVERSLNQTLVYTFRIIMQENTNVF